jgi:hypothetical protein
MDSNIRLFEKKTGGEGGREKSRSPQTINISKGGKT